MLVRENDVAEGGRKLERELELDAALGQGMAEQLLGLRHAVDDRVVVDAEAPRRGAVVGALAEESLQRGEQAAALVVCDRQRRRGWNARSAGTPRRRGRTARPARRRA